MVKSIQQNSKYDIMVKSHQTFEQRGETKNSKNFPSKGVVGSQNLETVPKLYLVIKYEGFPKGKYDYGLSELFASVN